MMLEWLLLSIAVAQAPSAAAAAPQVPSQVAPPAEPRIEPYAGTLREGRIELAQLSKLERHGDAARVAASLVAKPEFEQHSESERAETLFAIGVVHGRARQLPEAVESFHRALGLAGSSELGRDAAYNSGTYVLQGAEELRLQIPEIREKLKLPPLSAPSPQGAPSVPSAPHGGAAGASGEQPDPLAVAREAYLAARSELASAWRIDSGDPDTRANLELVQRRLKELQELEKQREQQQQDQQQKQDQKDPKQDPSQQDPSKSDSKDPQQDQQKDPDSKPDEQPEPKVNEQPQEQQPEEQKPPAEQKDAQPDKAREEMLMTPEEMQRLLDQMQKIDEQAREVQAMLRERRKQAVKKDW